MRIWRSFGVFAPQDDEATMTNPDLAAKDVADRIRAGRNFLITSHRNPDGDALGSGLALQRLIRQMGKAASMQVRDGFNRALYNIPGANEVAITDSLPPDYPNDYDAIFTMECPEVERTGYPVLPGPVLPGLVLVAAALGPARSGRDIPQPGTTLLPQPSHMKTTSSARRTIHTASIRTRPSLSRPKTSRSARKCRPSA